ncbi:hypothetical protein LRA02_06250 [Lentilactobacillus rapi]|uniref:Uncharacterized protein n=1 Tax=Lentilactobacillus rapi TaxID=481723 RepID=A0A512PKN1_9LACO|nr:hypothetical protein LRA02_06250 [Lentilactobacillus rapi]
MDLFQTYRPNANLKPGLNWLAVTTDIIRLGSTITIQLTKGLQMPLNGHGNRNYRLFSKKVEKFLQKVIGNGS